MTAEEALSWGWVGPCLRGSGVAYDVRKDHPYPGYEQYDFDVPVGEVGDCYDRYLVRMEEIWQSVRIIEQALAKLPGGPGHRGRQARGPAAQGRGLQQHRSADEPLQAGLRGHPGPAGRGLRLHRGRQRRARLLHREHGREVPWRVKVRPPCFNIYQAFPHMIKGQMLADAVAIIGGLNVIAGELDR